MPLAHLYILEGREAEKKETLIAAVTDAICGALGAPRDTVRVIVQEVPKTQWGIGGVSAERLGR
jgi:4-oxalocrotonate tautomerase